MGASLARPIEISRILNVHTDTCLRATGDPRCCSLMGKSLDDIVWQSTPGINEMPVNGPGLTCPEAHDAKAPRVKEYLEAVGPNF